MFEKNKNPPSETGAKSFCDICKREHVGGSKHCRFRDDKGGTLLKSIIRTKTVKEVEEESHITQNGTNRSRATNPM
jgi:hypothetical protein